MSDEKKIIIDEDWKSRVAAEKEQERKEASETPAKPASDAGPKGVAQLPPASFNLLITSLATEAMIGLGQLPHPITQQFHPDSNQARYAIDMLEVLAEKTKGNLNSAEQSFLEDVLHQLRMAFVAVGSQAAPATQADTRVPK
jgi:hypothetical protein